MKALLRLSIVLIAVAALAGSLFLLLPSPASAADATVPVGNFFFCSSQFQGATCTTTVNVGDTVTWDFGDATVTHTSSSSSGGWNSGNIAPGGSFEFTFTQAGSFSYVCNIHPSLMMGTVVVQAAAATATPPPGGTTPVASSTPAAGATVTPSSGLPTTGQGPQSGGADWWLLAGLAIAGVAFAGTGLALARRAR